MYTPFELTVDQLWIERGERDLCRNLSFSISSGDVIRIAGENGAGKSSLMKALLGLVTIEEGMMVFNGEDISIHKDIMLGHVLYLGHLPGVKSVFSVKENLLMYCPNKSDSELEHALAKVNLLLFADTPTAQLSAGQKRRVALARLWLTDKPLWLLDEPFTALDVRGVSALEERIQEHVQQGGAVLLTTHQPLLSLNPKLIEL